MPVIYTGLNVLGIDLKLIEMPSHRLLLQQPVLVIIQYIGFMSDGNALRVEQCLGYGMRGGCKHVSTEKSTPPLPSPLRRHYTIPSQQTANLVKLRSQLTSKSNVVT